MKLLLALLTVAAVSTATQAEVPDASRTRRVINGDLLYRATSFSGSESQAVFLAQARVAYLLAVECGAPPQETRIYQQDSQRLAEGGYHVAVEAGTPITDCERLRRTPIGQRSPLSHPLLARTLAAYENPTEPRATPQPAVMEVLWTPSQEAAHARALDGRLRARLGERRSLARVPLTR